MKKAVTGLLLIALLWAMVSCAPAPSASVSEEPQESSSSISISHSEPQASSLWPEPVQALYDGLKRAQKEYELLYDLEPIEKGDFDSYKIPVGFDGDFTPTRNVHFVGLDDGSSRESFSLSFNPKEYNVELKDFIAATVYFLGGETDFDAARTTAQEIVNGYNEFYISTPVEVGSYVLLLSPDSERRAYFQVTSQDEFWYYFDDTKEYPYVDFDAYQNCTLNKGMPVSVEGEMVEYIAGYPFEPEVLAEFTINATDGNMYRMVYTYVYSGGVSGTPYRFIEGESYRFYGAITATGHIRIDFAEEIE